MPTLGQESTPARTVTTLSRMGEEELKARKTRERPGERNKRMPGQNRRSAVGCREAEAILAYAGEGQAT